MLSYDQISVGFIVGGNTECNSL